MSDDGSTGRGRVIGSEASWIGVYGLDDLVEYGNELVVLPRLCEHCLEHTAVYYDCSWWPSSYECRACLESDWQRLRERLSADSRRSPGRAP